MVSPAPPSNVVPTVDANDQITLTWDHDPTWFAFDGTDSTLGGFNEGIWYSTDSVDHFEIQLTRDGNGWTDPSGGPTTVSATDSTSYSATYGPNSDNSYDSQVGIDSEFRFHVRAVNADGASDWVASTTVYTEPVPPHNPSVSRPDANTFEISATCQSDIGDYVQVEIKEDTGNGYGSWKNLEVFYPDNSHVSGSINVKGERWTGTINVNESYQYDSLSKDSRYQFRIHQRDSGNNHYSKSVYADYGNDGNVFFEDDFESGDLSAWDSNNLAGDTGVQSGTGDADLTISGADEGTYYFYGEGDDSIEGTWLQKDLGDLSNETDVIVKCAFATASLDDENEDFGISWYDGSSWQSLQHFQWEYNKQGWYEVSVLVPDSYLNTNSQIRVGTTTSTGMYAGDYFAVDRVVVSDILHEYTKPAAPSNLQLDNSVEGKITATWTDNSSFEKNYDLDYKRSSDGGWSSSDSYATSPVTQTGLLDGEEYDFQVRSWLEQYRNGVEDTHFNSSYISSPTITRLPHPTSASVANITASSADLSWTNNANNGNQRVYLKEAGEPSGMDFDSSNTEYINFNYSPFGDFDFSVSYWIKALSQSWGPVFDTWLSSSAVGVISSVSDQWGDSPTDRISFGVRYSNGNANNIYTDGSYADGNWHHVVVTYDDSAGGTSGMKIWIDGNDVSTSVGRSQGDGNLNSNPLNIGQNLWDPEYFDGSLANMRIYDNILSSTEIQDLYNGESISNGLVGYWPLDLNQSGTTPDLSEFSNDGTVNGATLTGPSLSDVSGVLSGSSYTLSGLLNDTTYKAFIHTETEHSITRDT